MQHVICIPIPFQNNRKNNVGNNNTKSMFDNAGLNADFQPELRKLLIVQMLKGCGIEAERPA